jgi:hypothetical protein
LTLEKYDLDYFGCGEPSGIIINNFNDEDKEKTKKT